jgi:hypothetical protein
MSHFAVIVVTDTEPTDEDGGELSRALQPFHEYECTGTEDQYVVDVDKTDECRAEFEKCDKAEFSTFENFVVEYYGYKVVGEGDSVKAIKRTNPNKKWDYWRIGGRWLGKFQTKSVGVGRQSEPTLEWEGRKAPEGVDICRKCDLDIDAMRQEAIANRRERVDAEFAKCAPMSRESFAKGCEQSHLAHAEWMKLAEPRPRGREYHEWCRANGFPEVGDIHAKNYDPTQTNGVPLEEWINSAPALSSFALLVNGEWHEKGEMGWWACVSNEKEDWQTEFDRLFAAIPDDKWLVVVDCHI